MEDETNRSLPKNKADLLARIEREWSALQQSIERLTPEQLTAAEDGGWSIKDNLAHLAAWEQFMVHYHLQGQPPHEAMGVDKADFERLDEDGLNAMLYERDRDHSVQTVLGDLKRSHTQVLAILDQIGFADLMKPRYADDPETRPLINWVIGNTYDHYQEHRQVIKALMRE